MQINFEQPSIFSDCSAKILGLDKKNIISSPSLIRCPKCNDFMEERKHRNPNNTKRQYYFEKWFVCKKCHHVQLFEKYKRYYGSDNAINNKCK